MGRLNKVQLIGNFGDVIQMHHFEGGGCIGRVSLATTETYIKKDTNEKVENVEWHNIVFRNKQAETVEKYTEKGSKMFVEGRLKYRKWDDKDKITRYSTEIIVKEFEFLSASKKADNQTKTTSSAGPVPPQDENDDLPF